MKIDIQGMHCDACVRRVRKALENVPGVEVQDVTVGSAIVAADLTQQPAVFEAIRKSGYEPSANT
ncbi:MAG: heavy metal-associated domain-containing protein [Acidobacteriota bacterium]